MASSAVINNGLEGIIVAETQISEVEGHLGRLIIRGKDAEQLAFDSSFEQTCQLLWTGLQATEESTKSYSELFGKARQEAFALLQENPQIIAQNNPMDALRTATSVIPSRTESSVEQFAKVTAALAVFASHWYRRQAGLKAVSPDPKLSHCADFLRMIRDHAPTEREVNALNGYLTTVSDHGMNASTFTARVVASTGSDNISCIVAAIGALKGPLHGGAPGPVLAMLAEIKSPENAERWLSEQISQGKRIMGMGHRIYKVRDPRAAIFERAIQTLADAGQPSHELALARAVEQVAETVLAKKYPDRQLKANVEFYTAVLLDSLQIPQELFSPIFACGRAAGWCAHIAEQRANGRLIRPDSRYTGPYPR